MSGSKIIELKDEAPAASNNDEKWQKLVLYYLARLKGLCDWRNNSRSKVKPNPKIHLKRCSSQELESRIIDKVTHKSVSRLSRKENCLDEDDVGCYMAAGYEEGKKQAVKIISRSLKYGVMTGILLQRGNCYRIAPEYLCDDNENNEKKKNITHPRKECDTCCCMRHKFSVKSVKMNVRKKGNKKKNTKKCKLIEHKKSSVTIKGKKRKRALNNNYIKKKKNNGITLRKGLKRNYDDNSDESPPNYKRNKRSSDTSVNVNESSNSNTSFQSLSRSLTPIDDRKNKRDVKAKRPRPKIQKPINYVPPLKKPRTKSQSKSPSHHTDDDEVNDKQNVKKNIINKFRMPRLRRYSDVMSSMSSSSLGSFCTICDNEKKHALKRTRRK